MDRWKKGMVSLALLLGVTGAQAAHLRITGTVVDRFSGALLANAQVRVYRNGVKQKVMTTGANGRYELLLDNNAEYVVRFAMPGHVTKCYTISTHGPAWEGDRSVKEVFIEMTLFERVPEVDLSFFDLPMGIARFDPLNGRLSWDDAYDGRIRDQVAALTDEVARALAARGALAKAD